MKRLSYILLSVLALTACTNSERADRAVAATDTVLPIADTTNKAQVYTADVGLTGNEKAFLLNAALSAKRINAFAHLATQQAKSTDLRNQAAKFAHQYNTMLIHLETLATGKGISLGNTEKIAELAVLKKEQGDQFDQLYTKLVLAEHANLIQQLNNGSKVANNEIKTFASSGLNIVNRNNSDMAKLLK